MRERSRTINGGQAQTRTARDAEQRGDVEQREDARRQHSGREAAQRGGGWRREQDTHPTPVSVSGRVVRCMLLRCPLPPAAPPLACVVGEPRPTLSSALAPPAEPRECASRRRCPSATLGSGGGRERLCAGDAVDRGCCSSRCSAVCSGRRRTSRIDRTGTDGRARGRERRRWGERRERALHARRRHLWTLLLAAKNRQGG